MEPTIKEREQFAVDPQAYRSVGDIRRWDIIIYYWPNSGELTAKRVAGLPGEIIEWSEKGALIDGLPLELPDELKGILKDFRGPHAESGRQQIPNDAIWVIGDRIEGSKDSRYDGPVQFSAVKGKVVSVNGKAISP
jgi:signal peptidase I